MRMKILVLNSGSSTLKFQLLQTGDTASQKKLAHGLIERIGENGSYRFTAGAAPPEEKSISVRDQEEAVGLVISWLRSIPELSLPEAVGHRVVHGGQKFKA